MSRELFARIYQEFQLGNDVILATILKRIGSAPRSGGSRMLVFTDGTIYETIGGGKLEAEVLITAHQVMATKQAQLKDYHFSGKDAASMEMICGGTVTILIEYLNSKSPQLAETIGKLSSLETSLKNGWWIQAVHSDLRTEHGCFRADWNSVWGVDIDTHIVREVNQISWIESPGISYLIERLNQTGTVYIFGAGHVAQPVAHLCRLVDFETVVIDDRPDFANKERFPDADKIFVSDSMESLGDEHEINGNSSVVIVTRGHLNDQVVLENVLRTRAGYIGMIGSKRKWAIIQEDLAAKGYSPAQIQRVHTPIGLDIGAETPAEIAVSIVAELVKARSERQKSESSSGQP